jgi:hypothetical protein
MPMDGKVLPTRKVSPPNGPMGSYPQTTPQNPSQRGMNAPADPPSHKQQGEISPFQPNTDRSI